MVSTEIQNAVFLDSKYVLMLYSDMLTIKENKFQPKGEFLTSLFSLLVVSVLVVVG